MGTQSTKTKGRWWKLAAGYTIFPTVASLLLVQRLGIGSWQLTTTFNALATCVLCGSSSSSACVRDIRNDNCSVVFCSCCRGLHSNLERYGTTYIHTGAEITFI